MVLEWSDSSLSDLTLVDFLASSRHAVVFGCCRFVMGRAGVCGSSASESVSAFFRRGPVPTGVLMVEDMWVAMSSGVTRPMRHPTWQEVVGTTRPRRRGAALGGSWTLAFGVGERGGALPRQRDWQCSSCAQRSTLHLRARRQTRSDSARSYVYILFQ